MNHSEHPGANLNISCLDLDPGEQCRELYIRLASAARSSVSPSRRPPLPLARAVSRPSSVRSRIRRRSNSVVADSKWNGSLPPGVTVSMAWLVTVR